MSRFRRRAALGPTAAIVIAAAGALWTLGVDSGPSASAAPTAASADGPALYAQHCSSCHGVDGLGVDDRGPSLAEEGEAAADFVLRTGRMPLAAPDLQAKRGPVRFDEAEIVALVAVVGSIGDGPGIPTVDAANGNVARGGELYRLNCAACHVSSGAGAPIGGGRIAPALEQSTPTEIGEAILVGPGSMPVFGQFESRDIDDIAAYVGELQAQDTTSVSRFGGAGPAAEGLAAWIIALIPMIAITRWLGSAKEGRDRPAPTGTGEGDGNG